MDNDRVINLHKVGIDLRGQKIYYYCDDTSLKFPAVIHELNEHDCGCFYIRVENIGFLIKQCGTHKYKTNSKWWVELRDG